MRWREGEAGGVGRGEWPELASGAAVRENGRGREEGGRRARTAVEEDVVWLAPPAFLVLSPHSCSVFMVANRLCWTIIAPLRPLREIHAPAARIQDPLLPLITDVKDTRKRNEIGRAHV